MIRRIVLYGGLLLLCLFFGHLALNATGVGNAVLEKSGKSEVGKTSQTKISSLDAAADEVRAKAANDAKAAVMRRLNARLENRKDMEDAARLAGLDPVQIGNYSDAELLNLLRNLPNTSLEAATAPDGIDGSKLDPAVVKAETERLQNELTKKAIEAETFVTPQEGTHRSELSGAAQKAALEALEAVPPSVDMPVFEHAPMAEPSDAVNHDAQDMESLLQRIETGQDVSGIEKDAAEQFLRTHPEINPGHDGSLDNVGGPDAGGYRFVDNSGDSANYAWIELRGDPSATWPTMSGTDGGTSPMIPFGFTFLFYGVGRDSFRISNDGNIQFTTNSTAYSNGTLPNTGIAGPVIFPYWDDQKLNVFGGTVSDRIAYRNFGTYTVVEWDSTGPYSSSCPNQALKYEAVLYNSGRIKFQYNWIGADLTCDSSVTIGIQSNSVAGSPALQYCSGTSGTNFTGPHPASGRAIWFYPTDYANNFATNAITSPVAATVYGASQTLTVTATFMNVGSVQQTAPVKYSFNGGATVTETSANLVQWATDPHTFSTTITTPAGTGSYPLTVWSDLGNDENRANDTLRINVQVFVGGSCASAIVLPTGVGTDSATYNNCGAGDNNPGVPCYPTSCYADMVFQKDVAAGHTVTFWVPAWQPHRNILWLRLDGAALAPGRPLSIVRLICTVLRQLTGNSPGRTVPAALRQPILPWATTTRVRVTAAISNWRGKINCARPWIRPLSKASRVHPMFRPFRIAGRRRMGMLYRPFGRPTPPILARVRNARPSRIWRQAIMTGCFRRALIWKKAATISFPIGVG
jgi:hypothetical protein